MDDRALEPFKPLILRGNRFLGAALQEHELISVEQLENANQRFLEAIQLGNLREANLMQLLTQGSDPVDEARIIDYVAEQGKMGLIDLDHYDLAKSFDRKFNLGACWATQTIPFDRVEGLYFLATVYALSQPVLRHWNEEIGEGKVIWYTTTQRSLGEALDRLQTLLEAEKDN